MKVLSYLRRHDLLETVGAAIEKLTLSPRAVWRIKDQLEIFNIVINTRAKSRFGQFAPMKKRIEITNEYFKGDWEKNKADHDNTVLHEVAHLIAHFAWGQERKITHHGREWKAVMRAMGLVPNRCGSSPILKAAKAKTAKHSYECGKCGHVFYRQREMKNYENRHHTGCGPILGRLVNHVRIR